MSIKNLYNTKKKKVIIGISILLLLFLILAGVSLYPFSKMENYMKNSGRTGIDLDKDGITEYAVVQCSFNLLNPEYAQVFEAKYSESENTYLDITFFKLSRNNIFSQSWDIKYNGYTSPYGTDFSTLVSLVKKDCNQFKQGYPTTTNPKKDSLPKDINWIYSQPPTEEQNKQQEADKKAAEDKKQNEQNILNNLFKNQKYTYSEVKNVTMNIFTAEDKENLSYIISKPIPELTEQDIVAMINYMVDKGLFGKTITNLTQTDYSIIKLSTISSKSAS